MKLTTRQLRKIIVEEIHKTTESSKHRAKQRYLDSLEGMTDYDEDVRNMAYKVKEGLPPYLDKLMQNPKNAGLEAVINKRGQRLLKRLNSVLSGFNVETPKEIHDLADALGKDNAENGMPNMSMYFKLYSFP